MDITNTSLINLDSITSGVREMIIGVVSAAIIFYLLFKRQIRIQKAEDMKTERCKELEGYLREHSENLVNDVLRNWFDLKTSLHTVLQDLYIVAETPLAKVIYELPKSRIIPSIELYYLKSDIWHQAVSHLRADEYTIEDTQFMDFWLKCETLSDSHLNKNVKVLESIEKKVLLTSIPKKFAKWDGKGASPPACYILDNTVYWIYQEAKRYMNSGEFTNFFKKDTETERGYIRVGYAVLCAKSPNEGLADEFIETVYGIAKDKTLTDELKALDIEKKKFVDDKVGEFKQELHKIIDNFEKGHYILKGTCGRCKRWVDELKSLDESYYKKLISPD